jgi:hypothetical protein
MYTAEDGKAPKSVKTWEYKNKEPKIVEEKDLVHYYSEYMNMSKLHGWITKGEVYFSKNDKLNELLNTYI